MKFLSIILVTLITFLALKPGMDELLCQENSCKDCCGSSCAASLDNKTPEEESNKNEDDCNGKSCNPFQVCGSCILICLHASAELIIKPTHLTKLTASYQLVFVSQFAPDFWQPPKIV
jgi:hypothetical protein